MYFRALGIYISRSEQYVLQADISDLRAVFHKVFVGSESAKKKTKRKRTVTDPMEVKLSAVPRIQSKWGGGQQTS